MRDQPFVGSRPHTRADATVAQKSIPCANCSRPAVGYDSRHDCPSCRRCARLRTDGHPGRTGPVAYLPAEATIVVRELNAFRRDLLAATALYQPDTPQHDDPYGVGLKRALEHLYDEPVNPGQLYPALSDLVDHDLLWTRVDDGRANYYRFIDRGRRALTGYAYFLAAAANHAGGDMPWPQQSSAGPTESLESIDHPRLPPASERDSIDRRGER